MYAIDFEYNGERLSDYGMMIGFMNHSEDGSVSSGGEIKFNQVKSKVSNKFHIASSSYEECYTATIEIFKNPCLNDDDNMYLSPTLVSQLQRWLSQKQYKRFKIIQDDYINIYWQSTFSCKQIMFGGRIIGLELTMYTDHPYAFNDEIEIEYECSNNDTFEVYNLSDEIGFIYPKIEITLAEDCEEFNLVNVSDNDRKTTIYNCVNNETIFFSGDTKIFSSINGLHSSIPNDFNYIFPRITNDYYNRNNIFKVNAACNIKITYSPIKKVGL